KPIESAISSVEGIDEIQTPSAENASVVAMMLKNGTDLDQALFDVRERVDQVNECLPDRTGDPNIRRFSPDELTVMWISVTEQDADVLTDLSDDQIVPYFERQEGVASVSVEGEKTREIQLELDEAKMTQYRINPQEVMEAVSNTN